MNLWVLARHLEIEPKTSSTKPEIRQLILPVLVTKNIVGEASDEKTEEKEDTETSTMMVKTRKYDQEFELEKLKLQMEFEKMRLETQREEKERERQETERERQEKERERQEKRKGKRKTRKRKRKTGKRKKKTGKRKKDRKEKERKGKTGKRKRKCKTNTGTRKRKTVRIGEVEATTIESSHWAELRRHQEFPGCTFFSRR